MKNDLLKILILEDEITHAEMIQRRLKKHGENYTFKIVMNKVDYINALNEFQPDVILSDNELPQFNATEALEILKSQSTHIPFILVTGTVSEEFAAGIIKMGADDYLLKDRLARLPAAIHTALKQKQIEREHEKAAATGRNITEDKKAEKELTEERDKFAKIAAVAPGLIYSMRLNKDGSFSYPYTSNAVDEIYGFAHKEIEKDAGKIFSLIHPDDIEQVLKSIIETKTNLVPLKGEYRYNHPAKGEVWHEVNSLPVEEPDDAVVCHGIVIDITERKNAEQKIIKANRLYFFISHISQMIVRATDEASLFKGVCRISVELGQFRMAWIGIIDEQTKKVVPVVHAGEEKEYLTKIKSISTEDIPDGRGPTGTAVRKGKYVICNDIENDPQMAPWKEAALERNFRSSMSLPVKKFDKIIGCFNVYASEKNFFDVTEIALLEEATGDISFALENFEKEALRKKAEEAVVKSEHRYHTLTEVSPVGIFHTNTGGYTTYVNPRWCEITGLSFEEALGNGWLKAVHQEDKPNLIKGWESATKVHELSISEYRFIRPDGTIAWVLGQATPERNSANEVVGYVGTITDITERKKSEEEIKRVNQRFEIIAQATNDVIWDWNLVTHEIWWNKTFYSVFGFDKQTPIDKDAWTNMIHPDDKKRVLERLNKVIHSNLKYWEDEYRCINRLGVEIFIFDRGFVMHDENGKACRMIGSMLDFTERKKIEDARKASEEKYRTLVEQASDAILIADNEGRFIAVNPSACKLSKYSEKELLKMTINDFITEGETNEIRIARFEQLQQGKTTVIERIIKGKDGIPLQLELTSKLLSDGMLLTFARDISERIKAQNDIINEKELSDSLINNLPGIFYLYDKEGNFLRWNKNFETVTGYSGDEIKKMKPVDFYDDHLKDFITKRINSVFKGKVPGVEAVMLTKTKKKIPFFFNSMSINYKSTQCLIGMGMDISMQKKAEEEIRRLASHLQDIREDERKRIGREIHDELGQQLTAIKMDVAWVNKKIPDEPALIKNKMKNVINLLDSSNQSIRRILNELRPNILENHGFIESVEWLGRQFTKNTGISVVFKSPDIEPKLSEPVITGIFRVYQEALNNITKYARASKVLTTLSINEDILIFTIKDDGQGFDPLIMPSKKSFGILGMKERIILLGGDFEIISSAGHGTKITVSLPINI